jgi:hypothetical protein
VPRETASVAAVDLIRTFDRAEKRPSAAFHLSSSDVAGTVRASIAAPVPSRAIWSLSLPRRATFRAFVTSSAASNGQPAGRVRVRIGISDDRIYEGLTEAVLTTGEPRWTEVRADLSAYAGWQWSLFYHPDRTTWRLVLSSDPLQGPHATVMWGTPNVLTDPDAAREYASRRAAN